MTLVTGVAAEEWISVACNVTRCFVTHSDNLDLSEDEYWDMWIVLFCITQKWSRRFRRCVALIPIASRFETRPRDWWLGARCCWLFRLCYRRTWSVVYMGFLQSASSFVRRRTPSRSGQCIRVRRFCIIVDHRSGWLCRDCNPCTPIPLLRMGTLGLRSFGFYEILVALDRLQPSHFVVGRRQRVPKRV